MDTPESQVDGRALGLDAATSDRRAEVRTNVTRIECDSGAVIDLSTRGMRITSRRRWRPGQVRTITLTDGEHRVTVNARCIWDRHDGVFHHTVGLAFENVRPEHEGMLLRFATEHQR